MWKLVPLNLFAWLIELSFNLHFKPCCCLPSHNFIIISIISLFQQQGMAALHQRRHLICIDMCWWKGDVSSTCLAIQETILMMILSLIKLMFPIESWTFVNIFTRFKTSKCLNFVYVCGLRLFYFRTWGDMIDPIWPNSLRCKRHLVISDALHQGSSWNSPWRWKYSLVLVLVWCLLYSL